MFPDSNLASSSARSTIAVAIVQALDSARDKRKREDIRENFKKMLERRQKSMRFRTKKS